MAGITNALDQLRVEHKEAQAHVEKLARAISVMESLNGQSDGTTSTGNQPRRTLSAAARQRIAQAQKARWAKVRKNGQPTVAAKMSPATGAKRSMSLAARKRIAAAQRARWAKVKAEQKKSA